MHSWTSFSQRLRTRLETLRNAPGGNISQSAFNAKRRRGGGDIRIVSFILAALLLAGCKTPVALRAGHFSHFIGLEDFSHFQKTINANGNVILLSPIITAPNVWNQLIVSWNANAPPGTFLTVEAAASSARQRTKFYQLGQWSPNADRFPRTSVPHQRDADGTVATDTLILNKPAEAVQIRVTLGGTNGALPGLGFLGLSFSNTRQSPELRPPHRQAWGSVIPTPECSQFGYPGENGWCSPASVSMVLARWAEVLNRPEMNLPVPAVAAAVYDPNYRGTGNWTFNTAFIGSFSGLRGYVTRFDDLSEVEDWIATGIPVILSARWDLLQPGRPYAPEGHLVVCVGFTRDGDVLVNDPAAHLDHGQSVHRVYRREDVRRAWAASHNTVYLAYPAHARIPENRYGHWER